MAASSSSSLLADLSRKISDSLSERERQVFDLFRAAAQHPDLPAGTTATVCRVAGGWVRDRILGVASNDIDIALDNTTGLQFARAVNQELERRGAAPVKIGLIAAQPDRGKHLETATLHLFDDFFVDFVHLRSPAGGSALGTPEQDALARDLTINALFFNLTTLLVEDWTGTGVSDLLHDRLIRTPVPPTKTYHDDPLRMLRTLRFANRYSFSLAPEVSAALSDADVQQGLLVVARERFTSELDAIFAAPSPLVALRLLVEHGLYHAVFLAGRSAWKSADLRPHVVNGALAARALALLTAMHKHAVKRQLFGGETPPVAAERKLCYLAALLQPVWQHCQAHSFRATRDLLAELVKPAMHITNAEEKALLGVYTSYAKFADAAASAAQPPTPDWLVLVGMTVRGLGDPLWKHAVRLAYVVDSVAADDKLAVHHRYQRFIDALYAADLHVAKKPLVTGQQLFDLLPALTPGPQVQRVIQLQLEWMYAHPRLGIADCSAYLTSLSL